MATTAPKSPQRESPVKSKSPTAEKGPSGPYTADTPDPPKIRFFVGDRTPIATETPAINSIPAPAVPSPSTGITSDGMKSSPVKLASIRAFVSSERPSDDKSMNDAQNVKKRRKAVPVRSISPSRAASDPHILRLTFNGDDASDMSGSSLIDSRLKARMRRTHDRIFGTNGTVTPRNVTPAPSLVNLDTIVSDRVVGGVSKKRSRRRAGFPRDTTAPSAYINPSTFRYL
jgi:hypothetical protein